MHEAFMRVLVNTILICLIFLSGTLQAFSAAPPKFDRDAWVRAKINALVLAARAAYDSDRAVPAYERILRSINRTIRRRKLSEDAGFTTRYKEFVEYIQAASLDQMAGHELGFNVLDRQYFAETRQYVGIPDFLMSRSFLRWVSRYETLERAKAFLRRLNATRETSEQLLFFSYKSRHLGTPDNDDSYLRFLIMIPGKPEAGVPEKWVQFGVTDPRARPLIRNVSVVSALVRSNGTFDTYFKDYFRTYRRDGSISIKGRWELGYGDDNCARCHKSGVLPIFPEAGSVTTDELQTLSAVNERFRAYGTPRFDKYLEQSKFGPGLSSASWEQRKERFGEDFVRTAVGRAMNCAACHADGQLGALNWPMDRVLISSFIRGGQMPFGHRLQESDRDELHAKLIQEYFSIDDTNPGILKAWLLGRNR